MTRDPSKLLTAKFPTGINIIKGDYTSAASLAPMLQGHDAVVDLTNRTATEIQLLIIDATIAAQVPRLVPSSFGTNTRNPRIRSFPHIIGKVEMEDYVIQKSQEGLLTFTGIQTGGFLDLALHVGWLINTKDEKATLLFDGGDRLISLTAIDSIGKAVAAALKKPEETENRFLQIHNVLVSQNRMLDLARELRPQRKWEVEHKNTTDLERASWDAFHAGDRSPMAEMGFFVSASFGDDTSGHFKTVDNSLLGVNMFSDDELKGFLARYI